MNADIDLSTENSDHMNNAQAAIAAIIVNHNVGSLLLGCVNSLRACPLDIEIIWGKRRTIRLRKVEQGPD